MNQTKFSKCINIDELNKIQTFLVENQFSVANFYAFKADVSYLQPSRPNRVTLNSTLKNFSLFFEVWFGLVYT